MPLDDLPGYLRSHVHRFKGRVSADLVQIARHVVSRCLNYGYQRWRQGSRALGSHVASAARNSYRRDGEQQYRAKQFGTCWRSALHVGPISPSKFSTGNTTSLSHHWPLHPEVSRLAFLLLLNNPPSDASKSFAPDASKAQSYAVLESPGLLESVRANRATCFVKFCWLPRRICPRAPCLFSHRNESLPDSLLSGPPSMRTSHKTIPAPA